MMSWINRRELFAAAGGVFAAWLTRRRAAAAASIPPAPVARVAVVKDTYFGETLSDPYRWMENDKDPDWLPFLRGQNEHTRAVLNTIPGRDRLLQRIQQLSGDAAATLLVQRAGGRLFYQQRPAGADNFKLFVREDGGASRVLIDPTLLSNATSHLSLDWWRASPDGSHVVYGVSKDGSEDSILHVIAVADGRELPERIANTEDANPQWLADGSGFFYNQLTGAVDTPERYLDSQARFHKLGADPESDPILMKRGLDPRVQYERIQMPYVVVHEGSRHALFCSPTCARKRASSSLRSPMQRPTGRSGRRWRASRTRSPTPRSMATRSICWPTRAIRAAASSGRQPARPRSRARPRWSPKQAWSSTALDAPGTACTFI